MIFGVFLFLSVAAAAAGDPSAATPGVDEVVARMLQRDNERQSALDGYTAVRRYVLKNPAQNKEAEMVVRLTCLKDGTKQFETISSGGWGGARKHVFPRLLKAEAEASDPRLREQSRFTPGNYTFAMLGQENVNGRRAYAVEVTPKTPKKFLMRGKIWIDAEDYAIVRIQGVPARNPSFWIKSVHFAHNYGKQGQFWFPVSDESITDVRIFGPTDLKIEYFDYVPNATALSLFLTPFK
jgi:outer membrane lipoprotein-sorting protein